MPMSIFDDDFEGDVSQQAAKPNPALPPNYVPYPQSQAAEPVPAATAGPQWITFDELQTIVPSHLKGKPPTKCDCNICTEVMDFCNKHNLRVYGYGWTWGISAENEPKQPSKPPKLKIKKPVWIEAPSEKFSLHENTPYSYADEKYIPGPSYKHLRTQKARGLYALTNFGLFIDYYLKQAGMGNFAIKVFPHNEKPPFYPCFARPCPTVPRHGFVESRVVRSADETLGVVAETLQQDPQGEVIFMTPLSAKWSGIVTQAGVNFGESNDGATAGKSVRTIPAWVSNEEFRASVGLNALDVATVPNSPYIEFVENKDYVVFVQLRDGPEVGREANFVPKETTVGKVIEVDPTADLLAWEKYMAKYAGLPGVVVYHAGGSLTSHFAVHAVMNSIPFITEGPRPKVGQSLTPTAWQPPKLTKSDYTHIAERLAARLHAGWDKDKYRSSDVALTAVGVLHASPQWGHEPWLLDLRAEGIAATLAFTATACVGELRHWYHTGPGQRRVYVDGAGHYPAPTCEVLNEMGMRKRGSYDDDDEGARVPGRNELYEQCLIHRSSKLHRYVKQAARDLGQKDWDGGYGGRGWADAAETCAEVYELAERFIRKPNASRYKKLMSGYNRLINQAHNSGNILNKWVGQSAMDKIAHAPAPAFLNCFAAQIALGTLAAPRLAPTLRRETVALLDGQEDGTVVPFPSTVDDADDATEHEEAA